MSLLPAGRELDALVAEKVMDIAWPSDRCRVCGWTLDPFGIMCRPENCSQRPVPQRRADEPASYSTDIRDAWAVAERMRRLGRNLLIMGAVDSGLVIASFFLGPHDRSDLSATEQGWASAPLAICRAALKALEVMA